MPDREARLPDYEEPLTLRDMFAMAALIGKAGAEHYRGVVFITLADDCYNLANAMMERRKDPR